MPSKLAFVDIETTGCSLRADRIIEVGVLRVENNKLVEKYSTLVNPETYLPAEIEALTGISARELEKAPTFASIYKDLHSILDGCVFTAHNVRFDYGFIKNEFRREGISFKAKNLCTVKLSRKLFPRFKHHSLDDVMERFDIGCSDRHRAFGDAEVLWKFYKILQKTVPKEKLIEAVNRVLKKPSRPINISEKVLDDLPESPGVYIFYGKEGMPLYVGKSVNIRDRVLSHFSGDHESSTEMKIAQQVESIETYSTAGEMGALFKEAKLVKELQPLYNRHLRNARKMIIVRGARVKPFQGKGLGASEYNSVAIEEVDNIDPSDLENIFGVFKSKKQAKNFLLERCREYQLCEKLLGLESGKKECFGYRLGKCHGACVGKEKPAIYNGRFIIAFSKNKFHPWPFKGAMEIIERSADSGEEEIMEKHIVDQWCYLGTVKSNGHEDTSDLSKEIKFDVDTYKILNSYFRRQKNYRSLSPFLLQ